MDLESKCHISYQVRPVDLEVIIVKTVKEKDRFE